MASNKDFVRVMVVLAMLVLLSTPSSAASIIKCFEECESGCQGKIKCMFTCVPMCLATGGGGGGGGADGAQTADSECKRRCFSSECIKFVDDEKNAIECMKSCDNSCEKKI